jgi:hypothetical protein
MELSMGEKRLFGWALTQSMSIQVDGLRHVRLNLLVWLINYGIMFFFHNQSDSAGLSAI